jgi:hypothetical protein
MYHTANQVFANHIANNYHRRVQRSIIASWYRCAIRHYNRGIFEKYHKLIKQIVDYGRTHGYNNDYVSTIYKKNNEDWCKIRFDFDSSLEFNVKLLIIPN